MKGGLQTSIKGDERVVLLTAMSEDRESYSRCRGYHGELLNQGGLKFLTNLFILSIGVHFASISQICRALGSVCPAMHAFVNLWL